MLVGIAFLQHQLPTCPLNGPHLVPASWQLAVARHRELRPDEAYRLTGRGKKRKMAYKNRNGALSD